MVTLKTPDAPATSKQLWLLHILTKTDTRKLKITMQEASNRIEQLKSSNTGKANNNGKHPQGDTARADYRVSGVKQNRPLVNPHASAVAQDKQKLAQAKHDRLNPKPEREVIQGDNPQGETDMAKIEAHFKANCYDQGRAKAGNDTARIDFYDFNCTDCLFGKTGICEPNWTSAGFVTCQGIVESVSFSCQNHEAVTYSLRDYCHRPKGKRCHRKGIDNPCLECNYRKPLFRDGHNHSAWGHYIPTIQDRIKHHSFWLDKFNDKPEALAQVNNMIRLLNTLIVN